MDPQNTPVPGLSWQVPGKAPQQALPTSSRAGGPCVFHPGHTQRVASGGPVPATLLVPPNLGRDARGPGARAQIQSL